MNLKRVMDIYVIIKERLPSTYPKIKMAFYEDEDCMLANTDMKKNEDESVYAVVNPATNTINLPLSMTFEYNGRHGVYSKAVPLNKFSDTEIAHTILHEIGHLYAGEKHGYASKEYHDEKYCDRFATRWLNVLHKEKLL